MNQMFSVAMEENLCLRLKLKEAYATISELQIKLAQLEDGHMEDTTVEANTPKEPSND